MSVSITFQVTKDGRVLANGIDLRVSAMARADMRSGGCGGTRIFRRDVLRKRLADTAIEVPRGVQLGDKWSQQMDLPVYGVDEWCCAPIEEWRRDGETPDQKVVFPMGEDWDEVPVD